MFQLWYWNWKHHIRGEKLALLLVHNSGVISHIFCCLTHPTRCQNLPHLLWCCFVMWQKKGYILNPSEMNALAGRHRSPSLCTCDAVYCAWDAVTIGSREGFVLLLFCLKFRTPRNGNLEFSASWGFHVRADAAAVLEKLHLYLGYSYITDFPQPLNTFHVRL